MKIARSRNVRTTIKHIFPRWINCVTWTQGQPKIYKWLWWNFSVGETK